MTNNIVPFKESDPKCSFCGTPKSIAKQFFAGIVGKYICGVCVAQCKYRLDEHDKQHS